ncbi:hypothetical protein GUJ93_ZPchr0010g8830 [Zizania palustris]|uniref:CRC domain-containing protein n=1 Tax=Zizania palustris TaxID=103762 RepID=A0A8J5W9H2_ZIZPA|nr:hypothetical protein GUJ93_ZPchr0010g8830 [Zizania palustris]
MEATPISVKPPSPSPAAAAEAEAPAPVEEPPVLLPEPGPATLEPMASQPAAVVFEAEPCGMNQLALTPNTKRQKMEEGADGNGCKHCTCKKSRCLKLYCPCFTGGGYCSEKCGCHPCFNKALYAETVQTTRKVLLSRQKRMSLKINRRSEPNAEAVEDAHHSSSSTPPKRGCNCKKSSCLKKYCDCYQDGTGCSLFCRCEDCRNPFGKNGTQDMLLDSHIYHCKQSQSLCNHPILAYDYSPVQKAYWRKRVSAFYTPALILITVRMNMTLSSSVHLGCNHQSQRSLPSSRLRLISEPQIETRTCSRRR